jgi:hypothetical protein
MTAIRFYAYVFLFCLVQNSTLLAQWVQSADLAGFTVMALLSHGSRTYAGTRGPTYVSTDHGVHWAELSGAPAFVQALASSGQYIFAGTLNNSSYGVFRSSDNGATWEPLAYAPNPLSFLGTSDSVLLCGYRDIQRSTDNGDSWTSVLNLSSRVYCLGSRGSDIYAGTESDFIQRSTNGGLNWTQVSAGLPTKTPSDQPFSITSLACVESTLFAGLKIPGAYRSDTGESWEPVNAGMGLQSLAALAASGSNLFAGTLGGGVFVTSCQGASWTSANTGLGNLNVQALAVQGDYLLAGTYSGLWVRPLSELTQGNTLYDLFPLSIGSKSSYDYRSATHSRAEGASTTDSTSNVGTVEYVVDDSVHASDSLRIWTIKQTLRLRHTDYSTSGGFHEYPLDTSYAITLLENLTGLHELSANGIIWNFPIARNRVYRYYFDPSVTISTVDGGGGAFDSQRGIFAINYYYAVSSSSYYDSVLVVQMIGVPTGVPERATRQPAMGFALLGNYPNPFNPKTEIRYQVAGVSDVKITVYDLLGREVAVLVNEKKQPGSYEVQFDASKLASGVYIYRLQAGSFVQTKKLLLIR